MLNVYPAAAATELKCKRDIGYFVDAVSLDVFLEGNKYTRQFVLQYFNNGVPIINGLVGEELASVEAFNQARTLMKRALTNQLTIKDLTITPDPDTGSNTNTNSCANVRTLIDNLSLIATTALGSGSISSLPSENAGQYNVNELKCRRDIGHFIDAVSLDIFLEGNKYSRKFVEQYFSATTTPITNGIQDEEDQAIVAFNMARDMMKSAITNQLYVKDLSLTPDPLIGSNQSPQSCANVRTSIDNLTNLITTTLIARDLNLLPIENAGSYQTNELKCRRDLGYLVDAVSLDVFMLGNKYTRKFAQQYFVNGQPLTNGLLGEYAQSISAFNQARNMMKKAVTNQLYVKDLTLTADSATNSNVSIDSCANVQSAIDTLIGVITTVFGTGGIESLPTENSGSYVAGKSKCLRDIKYFIDAISLDVFLENNKYSRKFVLQYFNKGTPISNGLVGETAQSVVSFNMARDMMKKAVTNQLYTKDLTLTEDPLTQSNVSPNSCANVRTAIDTLTAIVTTAISTSSVATLPSEGTSSFNTGENKCRRDIGYIVDAIASDIGIGGNASTITATKAYFNTAGTTLISNGVNGEVDQSVVAFNMARDMMKKAATNQLYNKDLSISAGPAVEGVGDVLESNLQSGNPNACTDVQSTISTLVLILTSTLQAGTLTALPELQSPSVLAAKAKCKRDIGYIVDAISQDLYDGNNINTITAIKAYFTSQGALITNGVLGEQTQSVSNYCSYKWQLEWTTWNNY